MHSYFIHNRTQYEMFELRKCAIYKKGNFKMDGSITSVVLKRKSWKKHKVHTIRDRGLKNDPLNKLLEPSC